MSGQNTPQAQNPAHAKSQDRHPDQRQVLRAQLQARRKQLTESQVAEHSTAIAANLQSLIGDAQHIGAYLAIGQEVSLGALLQSLRQMQRATYVPVVRPEQPLVFVQIDDSTHMLARHYGIMEPDAETEPCIEPQLLDLVLLPLVGFDSQCNRMGMGGGYYDRTFAHRREVKQTEQVKPLLIGVAHECQAVPSVLPDWWDVPLDHIVTENRVISAPDTA